MRSRAPSKSLPGYIGGPVSVRIEVVVFDDSTIIPVEATESRVAFPRNIELHGVGHLVDWHQRWHARGERGGRLGEQIKDDEVFDRALDWCLTHRGMAICFFDFLLQRVQVLESQVEKVGELALLVSGRKTYSDATVFFNSADSTGAQGLLLAAALASNQQSDTDIWLATGMGLDAEMFAKRLQTALASPRNASSCGGSLSQVNNPESPARKINAAILRFADSRNFKGGPESEFWPDHAADWFKEGSLGPPAPHSHSAFMVGDVRYKLVEDYLVSFGLSPNVARLWLAQPDCYSSLLHFVGGCAGTHYGVRPPTLGCLLLAFLKATGPGAWTPSLNWLSVPARPIVGTNIERELARALVLSAWQLFRVLSPDKHSQGRLNPVHAEFVKRDDGTHLFLEFGFDCATGDDVRRPSLSANAVCLGWLPRGEKGDASAALERLLRATIGPTGDRELLVSLYPVHRDGRPWTRLDFKARS